MSFDLQYPFSLRGIMGEANRPIERPSEAKVGERPSQGPTIVCPIVFQSKRLGAGQLAYCEDCIQTDFLNKDIFCPNCESKVTSPDKLRIDKPMHKKVIRSEFRRKKMTTEGFHPSRLPESVSGAKLSLFHPIN